MKYLAALALVGSTNAQYLITGHDAEEIAIGFLEGAGLSGDIQSCFDSSTGIKKDAELISKDCQGSQIVHGTTCITDIYHLVQDITTATAKCEVIKADAAKLAKMLAKLKNPVTLVFQLVKDVVHLPAIKNEVDEAIDSWNKSDYEFFGEHLGKVVAEITGVAPFSDGLMFEAMPEDFHGLPTETKFLF